MNFQYIIYWFSNGDANASKKKAVENFNRHKTNPLNDTITG